MQFHTMDRINPGRQLQHWNGIGNTSRVPLNHVHLAPLACHHPGYAIDRELEETLGVLKLLVDRSTSETRLR